MQHFDFSFRILYFSNWIIVFSFTTCLNPCKNHCSSKWHDMFVSWHNNHDYKCTHDYSEICQVLSEQVHSQYFSGCKSISMERISIDYFKNWNHPPYLWHNFILVCLIKLIRILALLWNIFIFLFNLFLKNKWYLHSWQTCDIIWMVAQSSIIVHQLFIYYRAFI